ncbi:hypothetical protein OHA59_32535 [Streptomyces sp. NBC_01589]|uniref:hypothetical protein n=1 Tax=Streptomyces sp. NBC_01589 TaxID=2975886 RepID=UPI00386FB1EB
MLPKRGDAFAMVHVQASLPLRVQKEVGMVPVRSTQLSITAALALALVSGMTAGCAPPSSKTSTRAAAPPVVAETPTIEDVSDHSLPVEKYLMSPTENDRIERARSKLIGSCMKRFGFDFTPNTPDYKKMSGQVTNRYGPTDPKIASSLGYRQAKRQVEEELSPVQPPLSADMKNVLGIRDESEKDAPSPTGDTYRGMRIPDGGCAGETDRKLTEGGGIIQDAEVAIEVNFRNFERSTADVRVKKSFADWARCMKGRNFSYKTPIDAINDPRWRTDTPSALEIATATAEVECKRRHNVIGIWVSVESAYEREDIKVNTKQLNEVRKGIDIAFKNAASVVGA